MFQKNKLGAVVGLALTGAFMVNGSAIASQEATAYTLQGPCAYLTADRATEFHGNPEEADLLLGIAGNQWVVFGKVIQGFNVLRGIGDGTLSQPITLTPSGRLTNYAVTRASTTFS